MSRHSIIEGLENRQLMAAQPLHSGLISLSTSSQLHTGTIGLVDVNGTTGNDRITVRHAKDDPSVVETVVNGKITRYGTADGWKVTVSAGNGNDFINLQAMNGDDVILGGNGNDTILGSQGPDSIDGGRGDDSIAGEGGNDSITGGIGTDVIRGGEGNDRLVVQIGIDDVHHNPGDLIVEQPLTMGRISI